MLLGMGITGSQVRQARVILKLSAQKVADAAGVSLSTVQRFEAGASEPMAIVRRAVREALERAGVEFIEGGVRIKPP